MIRALDRASGKAVLAAAAALSGGGTAVAGPPAQPLRGFDQWPSYSGDLTGSGLEDMGGHVYSGANLTIEGKKNFQLGSTSAHLTGTTTVRGCLFEARGTNDAAVIPGVAGDLVLEHCTVRPSGKTDHTAEVDGVDGYQYGVLAGGTSSSPGTWNNFVDGSLTVSNCHVWGFANASKESGSTQAHPHQWLDCVIENPRLNNNPGYDDHTDGLGSPGGGSLPYYVIDRCWIIGPGANTNGIALQNSGGGTYDHVSITNSVLGGFGYLIQISQGTYPTIGSPPHLTFTGNTLHCAYPPGYGPLYSQGISQGTGTVWSGNRVYVPAGASFGDHATQDGLYWVPTADSVEGTGSGALAPFVSPTDYAD